MPRFLFAPFALWGLLLCSTAATAAPPPTGEQLFLVPPQSWTVVFHRHQGPVELTELVPPGQTAQEWTDMLVVQLVSGQPERSPQDVLKEQTTELEKACDGIGSGAITPSLENGFETALRVVACGRSKRWGKGEINLYKVIRGHERTYMVSRSWRGPPFDKDHLPLTADATAQWLDFMQRVILCDSRMPQHPCPKSAPPEGAGK